MFFRVPICNMDLWLYIMSGPRYASRGGMGSRVKEQPPGEHKLLSHDEGLALACALWVQCILPQIDTLQPLAGGCHAYVTACYSFCPTIWPSWLSHVQLQATDNRRLYGTLRSLSHMIIKIGTFIYLQNKSNKISSSYFFLESNHSTILHNGL